MEETQRVDIKVDLKTLAWAASEATKLGVSRRKYLAHRLRMLRLLVESGVIDLDPFKINVDGYTVTKTFNKVPNAKIISKTKPE